MTSFAIHVESLPAEAFTTLCAFLAGYDLVTLSHVNRFLLKILLTPDNDVWRQRLAHTSDEAAVSAKQSYCTSRSYQFPGLQAGARGERQRGGAIAICEGLPSAYEGSSFSISIHFAMLPSPRNARTTYTGGILLGAQSYHVGDPDWPEEHHQYIHVDPQGNLYCSVTSLRQIVAKQLQVGRWYHVVLTYGSHGEQNGVQSVYLDGTRIHSSEGNLHERWNFSPHYQFGTGCMSGGAMGEPSPNYSGWYPFCGLFDRAQFWMRALTPSEVIGLYGSGGIEQPMAPGRMMSDAIWFNVKIARCSRPTEGLAEAVGEGVLVNPPGSDGFVEINDGEPDSSCWEKESEENEDEEVECKYFFIPRASSIVSLMPATYHRRKKQRTKRLH